MGGVIIMVIRTARLDDWYAVAAVEKACFSPGTAAEPERIKERLTLWPDHFWLLLLDGRIVSFIDGMAVDEEDLKDEMYADAALHRPDGAWQMIFGVCTLPEYRHRGYAGVLMKQMIGDSKKRNRKGIVLTCREPMIPFYESFGFITEGASESRHGGVPWVQMRMRL